MPLPPKTIPIDDVTDWLSDLFQRINNAVPTGENADGSDPLLHALSTGTSTVYVLTLEFNPSARKLPNAALNDGLVLSFRAHVTCGDSPTVNPNTIGATGMVLPSGAKVRAGDIQVNDLVILMRDATADNFIYINYAKTRAISLGQYKNLVIGAGGTPDEEVDVDADEVILEATGGAQYRALLANLTISNVGGTGANKLDTGAVAADTWYHIWVIFNPATNTLAGLLSLSSTAPTMPSGYTFKALVGAIITDGAADFIPITQEGNRVIYDAVQTIKDGSFTAAAWTAQSVTGVFPPTAKKIQVAIGSNGREIGLSPRSDGHAGEYFEYTHSVVAGTDFGGVMPSARRDHASLSIKYAASIYYYVSDTDSTMVAVGWEY